jgi:hypothetical protein
MSREDGLAAMKGLVGRGADVVWSPLYDYQRVTPDEMRNVFQREFFICPIGERCPTGLYPSPRTREDTNLYHSGALPLGNDFYTIAIKVFIVPGWDRAGAWSKEDECDFDTLSSSGHLELRVQNRIWAAVAPLAAMPTGFITPSRLMKPKRLSEPHSFLTPFLEILKEVKECVPKIHEITPVYIQSQKYFCVRVDFFQSLTIESDALLGVILDGYLIRNAI